MSFFQPALESRRRLCTGPRSTSHLCDLSFTPSPHLGAARAPTLILSLYFGGGGALTLSPHLCSSPTLSPDVLLSRSLPTFPTLFRSLLKREPLRASIAGTRATSGHVALWAQGPPGNRETRLTRVPSDWLGLSDGFP